MIARYVISRLARDVRPAITRSHCKRKRAGNTGCQACVLACRFNALSIDEKGALAYSDSACVGCGACLPVCPSQAIKLAEFGEHALVGALQKNDAIAVGCLHGKNPGSVAVPCLSGLHPEFLVVLMLAFPKKTISLDIGPCPSCDVGMLLGRIRAAADQASAYAELIGVKSNVVLSEGQAEIKAAPARGLSRRDFFGLVRNDTVKLAAGTVLDLIGSKNTDRLAYREMLLTAVRRQAKMAGATEVTLPLINPFYCDWDVADSCDGCSKCVTSCPTGAMKNAQIDGVAVLSHDVALCTACGLCAEVCPHDSLTPRPALITADAGRVAKRKLLLAHCKSCNVKIPTGGDGKCENCRKREGLTPA